MQKQDLRVIKTKKNLFNKLLQLLQTYDFNDITVTKLCEHSEINRSTFYTHYSNIDDLFETHMIEIMNKLNEEYKMAYNRIYLLEKAGLTNVFQHILDNRDFYDILFSEKIPTKFTLLFIQHYMQLPKEIISKTVRSEIDYELYYTFCASATIGIINHWRKTGYAKSALEMSTQTMTFFSNEL
ncbi:TetR/AcrR family transcriptional regulator [Bacillus sp. ISL-4]|uniref:TetR/AcrR family transcriptional regulator n=1 Tax=Bacillus sp. ISL-4 TaxID=2819125 RepID=UPI001BED0462|nr:TetR/AcrR family transcriptional regulator [Bacillus sp. ISL-4]MBT2668677.1 TetR/AcrR family transcriptional regulator [Bacillus sp. ISL-4]MBT2669724.1 TetR/AcrR family transcriptional regulator [Streptomyces sp. ISL-14]